MQYICRIQEGGKWGGLRENAGRRRRKSKGVAHRMREVVKRHPLHVNFKYRLNVRNKETLKLLKRSIQNARGHGLRILHYSFQSNHIHLIIEADSNRILTKGMRSLTITFAKGLQKGRVQMERYHLHVLKTLREAKNAVHYVLFNQQKHERGTYSVINEYSSVLSLKNGLELIRNFAKEKKITITIQNGGPWIPDQSMFSGKHVS
ncbi:MAG: transposase [Bdellovibrionota bacterium]